MQIKSQKYHLNRINYLILIFLFIALIPKVNAKVTPTDKFYVNDYANILSEETEEYILNKSIALNQADGTQIVVVTVPNLDGSSIEEYAVELYRDFGIGSKDKNNGLLFLFTLEEREFRVEVGYGLEGILPDGKTGRFQDEYIIPYFKNNNFDEGIKKGYDAFYSEIVKQNNLNLDYSSTDNSNNTSIYITISIIIGILFGIIARVTDKKSIFTMFYAIIFFIVFFIIPIYINLLIVSLFSYMISAFIEPEMLFYTSFGGRGGSGGSSFGGFSGGGGLSGGGGSTRKF